jgi:hypothetical protein
MVRVSPQLRGRSKQDILRMVKDGRAFLDGDVIVPTVAGGAAPPLANTLDGGTQGTAMTTLNTGGTSGDAFNVFTSPAPVFDNTHAHSGTFSMLCATAATPVALRAEWTTLGSITGDAWVRGYFWFPSVLATQCTILGFRSGSGGLISQITIEPTTMHLRLEYSSLGTNVGSTATGLATGQWVRVEVRFNPFGGALEAWFYNTPDAAIGSPTDHVASSGGTAQGGFDQLRIGVATTPAPASYSLWIDDLAVSTSAQIGPNIVTQSARPDADVTDGGWVNRAGSNVNLYQSIDEATADDTDYIQSSLSPSSADMTEINLSDITP